jgi:TP901 family phage tail tape measure protein
MAGNEWVIKVTADVKDVLEASRKIGQAGKEAGQSFQEGFNGSNKGLDELGNRIKDTSSKSKEFVESQKIIAKTQSEVDSALSTGTGIINGLKEGIKQFALQTGAILTVAAAFQLTADQVIELDKASAAVRTLGVDSKELSDKLLNLSIELGSNISRVELMKAAYDVASSGFSTTAQITDILRASALGASGGFAELNDVTKAVTGVINAYGLTTDDATKIVDGFVQTQADGVITVREYAAQIGTVASVAAAAGIPISELNAAIATATLKGVPVEQSFTGIRQAITSILKPSAEATNLANSLGISFNLSGLQARGFGGLLADVQAKTGGAADKLAILLGSVEAQAAVQPIVNDGLKKYNELLDKQKNSSGAAAESSKVATETIAGGFDKVKNAASNLATTLNTALPGVPALFSELARAVELAAKLIQVAGPAIGKTFEQIFMPFFALAKVTGLNKLFNDSIDWVLKLLTGNKDITAEQAKQEAATEKTNERKKEQAGINQDILDNAKEQNRIDLINLDVATKKEEAQKKLVKAQLDGQISVQQANISLGQALISLEDSRFSIIRNRNTYELEQAKKRGASEAELDEIKRRGETIELAALNAKYQGLLKQQGLEKDLLALKQEQARQEAYTDALKARAEYKKADLEVTKAILAKDKDAEASARATRDIKQVDVEIANTKLGILGRTQPIEQRIAAANSEAARNQII